MTPKTKRITWIAGALAVVFAVVAVGVRRQMRIAAQGRHEALVLETYQKARQVEPDLKPGMTKPQIEAYFGKYYWQCWEGKTVGSRYEHRLLMPDGQTLILDFSTKDGVPRFEAMREIGGDEKKETGS